MKNGSVNAKAGHNKSCTSSQIGGDEIEVGQPQPSKKTTVGPEEFLEMVEVANLSA